MDSLLKARIQESRSTSPATKLAQALEMMDVGIRLKRTALAKQRPEASAEEIERAVTEWLVADG